MIPRTPRNLERLQTPCLNCGHTEWDHWVEAKPGELACDSGGCRCRSFKAVLCVDCREEGITTIRPVEGKRVLRCATHRRTTKKRAQRNAHGRMVQKGYGITAEQYQALYEAQGGRCAICQVATGKTKRLAVDHDHDMARDVCGHPVDKGCPRCIRGLTCGPCNQMLGRLPKGSLQRAIDYYDDPPARRILNPMWVILPRPVSASEAFWLWTPFDEDGQLDRTRLESEGWTFMGAMTDEASGGVYAGFWSGADDMCEE